MATTLDSKGNEIINGFSTNLSPSQNAISTNMLGTAPTPLPVASVADTTPIYNSAINTGASLTQSGFDLAQKQADELAAQNQYVQGSNTLSALQGQVAGKAADQASIYQNSGINDLYKQLSQLNVEAQGLARESQAAPIQTQQESIGLARTDRGIAPLDAAKRRDIALRSLELGQRAAIAQGNYDVAKNLADQQIAAKYAGIDAQIEAQKTNLAALDKIVLTPAQEKRKEAQAQLLKYQEQIVAERKANDSKIQDLVINASQQGAPTNLKNLASQAKTPMEAAKILGQYAGDYWGTKYKIAQINKLNADAEETRAKVAAAGGVGSKSNADTQTQAKFLLDTIAEATNLSGASGRSKARRGAESYLTGATDYTNLEAKVRTVKNNLLTLATDPNIKKFFGPQMTDSDVRNMLSAATTLDTEGQTPDQLKAELNRVNGIFSKFAPGYTPAVEVKQDAPTWAQSIKNSLLSPTQGGTYGYQDNNN